MNRRDTGLMLALAAVWGLSFLFLKVASPAVGPLVVAAFRVAGGALVLSVWLAVRRTPWPSRAHWRPLLTTALLSAVLPFMGLSYAARHVPAGLLSILNATTPLWGALVAWLWAGEPLNRRQWVNLLLGFASVTALVTSQPAADQAGGTEAGLPPLAVAAALASTLMYALAVHQNKRQLGDLPALTNSWGTLVAASLVLLGPALVAGPWPDATHPAPAGAGWSAVPGVAWAALGALAVLCTGLAYVWFYDLLERVGPTQVLMVTYLIPVFGMAWSALLLGEAISGRMLLCAALIVGSTMWAQRAPQR
ncbi:MAG: hypothetical protein RI907_779 [Pseudomonadota bacterium]|jgi:drug/metabolite transporter (DMT)-like permease